MITFAAHVERAKVWLYVENIASPSFADLLEALAATRPGPWCRAPFCHRWRATGVGGYLLWHCSNCGGACAYGVTRPESILAIESQYP
jgi:hypothetical protein